MSKNFTLKLDAIVAIISNPDGRTAREGMVQPGECPTFTIGEVMHELDLRNETDPVIFRAAFVVLHLSGGGCPYRFAKWAAVQVQDRYYAEKKRRTEAFREAIRLGAKPEQLHRMSTDQILDRCEQKIAERRAEFFSKLVSTVRSINIYEKAMRTKLTDVGVEPDASKKE